MPSSSKMNIDELKTMIASEVKTIGLNDVLDASAIEKIKNRVMDAYNYEQAKNGIQEVIPEAVTAGMGNVESGLFPGEYGAGVKTGETSVQGATSVEIPLDNYDSTQQPGQKIDIGTTGNIPSYTPELPSFLDKIEPAKVIIFSQNETSEGAENLTHKPLRTFSDPDVKKSMNDFWVEKGQRRAEVYLAKLEKIGEIEFDYANGTSQFIEKRFEPDFEVQSKYKENPYMANNAGPATPGALDINGQPNIMNQIYTSVDLEKVVSELVMKILRDHLLANTTKAVSEVSIQEPFGYSISQSVKPMEESLTVKMIDLVNEYVKIDAPSTLKEAMEKNDKKLLIKENEEVQEWLLDGKTYYTPTVRMSTKKCYVKS